MTDPYSGPATVDIETDPDTASAWLDREADAILLAADPSAGGARPLRRAVREDARLTRDWGRAHTARLHRAVRTEPVRASLYALGLGVVMGLLIAR